MQATSKQEGSSDERTHETHTADARRPWRQRALAALRESAWTALGGKVAAYVAGFFALALVGSGHALSLLPERRGEAAAGLAMVAGSPPPHAAADPAPPPTAGPQEAEGAGATQGVGAAQGAEAAAAGPPSPAGGGDAGAPASGGVTADGKVVLNLATEADLMRLPGVGPAKAAAILALRAKIKRFRKVEDLLRVKGFGRRSLKRLRPLVLVDPP
ncbi:ComEA family DNA-binding protein [Sorangium sp. So ce131]|uniref:ComEA family DNA-binding protein n=1 Tax=Sorangium sp. So ce131 TaxID=3133282 RepID=UPI003F63F5DF